MIKPFLTTLFLFAMLLCGFLTASAQPYEVKWLDVKEGLSNNHVVSIAQDKRGFLWFATEEGLNLFDGLRFKPYYKGDASGRAGLTANELNCVLDDPRDSILWIGTQRAGLNAYHYKQHVFTSYLNDKDNPQSLSTNDVTDISPSADGNLWVSTYWEGVDYFDKAKGTFTHYNTGNVSGLPSNQVWCVTEGREGTLFIGHVRHGLSVLSVRERTVRNFVHDPRDPHSLPGNEISCIYRDLSGNIWIGTDNGLALYNPETENFIVVNDAEKNLSYRVHDIRQMNDNKLWIAMEFGGIAILDLTRHLFHNGDTLRLRFIEEGDDELSLSKATIRSLLQDSFGNVWAGSWGGGINFIVLNPPLFSTLKYSPYNADNDRSLTGKTASSVTLDREGNLWVGTDDGEINVFHKGKRMTAYHDPGRMGKGHSVQAALCDSEGGLWFGLFNGGVLYCEPQTRRFRQVMPHHLANIDVRAFCEDDRGNILVGSSGGMYVIDRDRKQLKNHMGSENDLVRCILQDSQGRIWVGYFGSGLGVYDRDFNETAFFNVGVGFPSNTLNDLYEDSRHRLWAATGDGLVCFPDLSDIRFRTYGREDGLVNTHIQAVSEDNNGNIWFSTNRTISCYLTDREKVYNYQQISNMPPGSFCRACTERDSDGRIYFGALNGLCSFIPSEVLREREAPPAFINHVEIYDPMESAGSHPRIISLNGQQRIRLTSVENSFNITFNVQNYALLNQVEYSYMLKGLEDSWYTVNTNNVTFRNLAPGNYSFMVRTRMHNQDWSDRVTSLDIYIAPPLWKSGWAKMLYVMFFLALLFAILYVYKKRLQAEALYKVEKSNHEREQELNNERLRFYTNITHELRTPLTLIVGPLEDLQKSQTLAPKDAQKISVIHQSALRLLNLINQILEFRKTETQNKKLCVSRGNIVTAVYEVGLKYKELNQKSDVQIFLETPQTPIQMYFDEEIVHTILDNLISNALKYTSQGRIVIGVRLTEKGGVNYTQLYVSDTGSGIQPQALPHIFERYYQGGGKNQASGTGIGLALVKNLVDLHEGCINVQSTPGEGSTFCVSLLTDNYYPNALHVDSQPDVNADAASADDEETAVAKENERPILLVVEDNDDIRHYIADALADTFEVHTAVNGKNGEEQALKLIPDIIVSDIMMPVMDGNEMCRTLKKDVRTSHIPIILLTAKDTLQDKEEGYAMGADSYLTKPFSASLLRSRIDNLLQTHHRLAAYFAQRPAQPNETQQQKTAIMTASLNKLDNEFLQKIDELIEERMSANKVDISYLSDKMCMSSSTLYRKVKALTGLSTNEYVRKIKMKYAEKLLLEGKYNISEIAFKIGFNNLFYFRQCFKDEFGCIPSEYLKKLKEESD